jgi:hypothetical protein
MNARALIDATWGTRSLVTRTIGTAISADYLTPAIRRRSLTVTTHLMPPKVSRSASLDAVAERVARAVDGQDDVSHPGVPDLLPREGVRRRRGS